jgi:hypothetical protein
MRSTLACFLALLAAAPALAQLPTESIDQGSFVIHLKDRAIGAETFEVVGRADSINAAAHSYLTTHTSAGDEMVERAMVMSLNRTDYSVRYYQANQTMRGQTMITGVVAGQEDTALTVFREQKEGGGMANRLVAPPGRLFVLDAGLYSLFDLICLNLHHQTFTTRPITVLTLSTARDTIIEAQVTDLGAETIRWGARPVQSRKLQLEDRGTVFFAWLDPSGRMLRLTHEASGLRVERDPPAVKRRAPTPPKPGG